MPGLKDTVKNWLLDKGLYYRWADRRFYSHPAHQKQLEFYVQFVGKGQTVFDIGANIGQRSKIFADLGAVVHAFEPQPYCIRHFNSRLGHRKNVHLHPEAVSDKNGTAQLLLSSSHTLATLSREYATGIGKRIFKNEEWNRHIEVPTTTLDLAIEKFGMPSLVKIDVEGHEYSVLRGLSNPVRVITFEFIPGQADKTIGCVELLMSISNNYRFNYTLGEALDFQEQEHQPGEVFVNHPVMHSGKSFGDIVAILPS
ncbi:MAG: hypothetical protein Kow0075_11310 [Salibacteraceae bacterium]